MMGQNINSDTVNMFATALKQRPEDEVRKALQAVIEGSPPGSSSLTDKFIDFGGGFKAQDTTVELQGVTYRRHPNGGGMVPVDQDQYHPNKPFVDLRAYIGPKAWIQGNTKIYDGVFSGGMFRGGVFYDGVFYDGVFSGGVFSGGVFAKRGAVYEIASRRYRSDADADNS